jgi:hypothetical protein
MTVPSCKGSFHAKITTLQRHNMAIKDASRKPPHVLRSVGSGVRMCSKYLGKLRSVADSTNCWTLATPNTACPFWDISCNF